MLNIDLFDETETLQEAHLTLVEQLLQTAAKLENIEPEAEVCVTFVTNEAIHEINRDYRDKDAPTDVISFALEERGEHEVAIVGVDEPRVLGDIIISVERAQEQADDYGHSFERELGFLALHGFLHLLGYDHLTEADEKKMFGRQDEILAAFQLER